VLPEIDQVVDKDIHRLSTVGKTLWITRYKLVVHWANEPVDNLSKTGDKTNG
jgi:hypothetical protein